MVFYQEKPYFTGNKVKVLTPKFENFNKIIALFIIASFKKSLANLSWGQSSTESSIESFTIKLPTKDNKPDFDCMESFIENIQKEHTLKLLKFYEVLKANGGGLRQNTYKDYLSSICNTSYLQWKQFRIGDLFSVKSNPQLNKDSFEFVENGKYPYFTRTVYNNGILGYVKYLDDEHKIKGNSIAVGLIAMRFFYMQKDFYAGQFTKTIYPKFENFNKYIALYFVSLFDKHKQKYLKDFVVKYFERDFTNTLISLPIDCENSPNFDFMESFISAVQKEVIKSVVLWSEKRINATKEVINLH